MSNSDPRLWGVIPAAGVGSRFEGDCPKQYRTLAGRAVLSWSLAALLDLPALKAVSVAVSPEDDRFETLLEARDQRVRRCAGGATRQESVRSALADLLVAGAEDNDWVLVHDAARPGLTPQMAHTLMRAVGDDGNGGLLAMPIGDTVKRGDDHGRVDATLDRNGLWAAQTPQYFPVGALLAALDKAWERGTAATDEASAMEAQGCRPLLVTGSQRNRKLTYPADGPFLEAMLAGQGRDTSG